MATKKSTNKPVTAYKAFDKDFSCRGFKFEVGKTYKHEGDVVICRSGFHACVNPLDVWSYYDLIDTRFAEVELSGEQVTHDEDSKIAAAEITIRAEITLPEFIRNGVAKFIELVAPGAKKKEEAASGYYAQLAASGNSAQLEVTGKNGVIASASINGRAKGAVGAWISLAEFNDKNECVGFAVGCIGQDGLEPDSWYRANGGKLVKVED